MISRHANYGTGKCACLALAATLFVSMPAAAEPGKLPLWEIGIGAVHLDFPDYRGSLSRTDYQLPFPYLVYRGQRLRVDRDGIRGLLFDSERLSLDISADGSVPVDSDQNAGRTGMPDLDPAFELGPSLDYRVHRSDAYRVDLRLPIRAVISTDHLRDFRHQGWLAHPAFQVRFGPDHDYGVMAGPLYGTAPYHRYYFGVDPEYATEERPAYRPGGGYSGFRITASGSRRYGKLYVGGFLRYDNLSGAAFADSPLVETRHALMGGFSLAWVFAQSAQQVAAPSW